VSDSSRADQVVRRLREISIELPSLGEPRGRYVRAKRVGELVYTAGHTPVLGGEMAVVGRVGADRTLDEGRRAAVICVVNCLAALRELLGNLNEVEEVIAMRGFVSSAPDFFAQAQVMDAASEILISAFGESGRHVRTAIGVGVLPGNATTEVELIVRVRDPMA
jgi:enamine deaminase RidA (YjgF/YER057c/UK114 family)